MPSEPPLSRFGAPEKALIDRAFRGKRTERGRCERQAPRLSVTLHQPRQPSATRRIAGALPFIACDPLADEVLDAAPSAERGRCPVRGARELGGRAGNIREHGAQSEERGDAAREPAWQTTAALKELVRLSDALRCQMRLDLRLIVPHRPRRYHAPIRF